MTVWFWLFIALMTLLAASFLVVPLLKGRGKRAYWSAAVVAVCFPVLTVMLYYHWGASNQLENYWALKSQAVKVKAELAKIKNPQQIIDQLKSHLQARPNSSKGWYLLGKLYLTTGRYAPSVTALAKAYRLNPSNLDYKVAYSEALFFNNHRQLTPQAMQLLKSVIARSPNNVAAINLLAINAYRLGHYQQAVDDWEKLIPMFQVGSRDREVLLSMIAKAQKHLKRKP